MVHVMRGTLIETDVPTKVLILFFNEQCSPQDRFVIAELDERSLFVQPRAVKFLQEKLREYHSKNTFVAPAKEGNAP